MIVNELAYKITVRAEEFLTGKKKVEQGVKDLDTNVKKPLESIGKRFDGLTDSVTNFGNAGKNAFNQVQMGAAKFLGIALSLEGARRLVVSTTRNLVDLGNTSSFLDMGAKSLDGFNRAAAATGASEQSMTSMLMRLKNAQNWMAMPMGAPDASTIAIQQLQGMTGVDIMGEKDPGKMLLKSATALRKLNKSQAEVMWGQMGGAPDMFGLVYSGKLSTMQKEFEKRSNATDPAIKRARDVRLALEQLNQAVDNLGDDFVRVFGQDINSALKEFGDWISSNRDNIIGFFQEGTEWAKKFSEAVGGSTNALILMVGMRSGPAGAAAALGYVIGDKAYTTLSDPDYEVKRAKPASEVEQIEGFVAKLKNQIADWWNGDDSKGPVQYAQSAKVKRTSYDPSALISAMIQTESSGDPTALGPKTKYGQAVGLMQVMPRTGADYGFTPEDLRDPQKNMMAGVMHFRRMLKKYNGNVTDALRAYNWGEGNMDAWISGGRTGLMPAEAQNYPGKVLGYYQQIASMASRPSGSMGSIDNSQQSHISIQKVEVNSNPQTVSQLTTSIENQASRSRMNISFSSGNN